MSQIKDNNESINLDDTAYPYNENKDILEIQIIGDGNCFYRCLSQEIDQTQDNYRYYRALIYNYITQNKTHLQKFFFREETETTKNYNIRYEAFIESIKNDYTFAGDFEISSASILLNKNIIIYFNTLLGYKLLNKYYPNKTIKSDIYIIYRNNNHFNLLKSKDYANSNIEIGLKELNKIHKKIEKNMNVNNINKIETNFFKPIFDKKYVDYRRKECVQLYNEIYKYLKTEEIPKRLISPFMQKVEANWQKKK